MQETEEEEKEVEPSPVFLGVQQEQYKENPLKKIHTNFLISEYQLKEMSDKTTITEKKFLPPGLADQKTFD